MIFIYFEMPLRQDVTAHQGICISGGEMKQLLICMVFLTLSGCAVGVFTSTDSYGTTDTLALARPAQDFVNVTQEVGRSLGYKVSGVVAERNQVALSDNGSGVGNALIGRASYRTITVTLEPGGRSVHFEVSMTGNMGSAKQEKAQKRLADLKAALAQRFR